jgi:membrane fusion protein (multidrug efflux system)
VICASIASSSAQQQAPAVVPVGTIQAEHKPIAKTKNFVGRVEAINKVEVHARVTGYWKTSYSRKANSSRKVSLFTI